MIKRRTPLDAPSQAATKTEACELGLTYAHVVDFISDDKYDDGTKRTPGSITFFAANEGGLRACLNDKDADEVAFVSGGSLTSLLIRLEAGLSRGELDWRSAKRGGKKK